MIKRAIPLLFIVLLLFTISACGGTASSEAELSPASSSDGTETLAASARLDASDADCAIVFSDGSVEISGSGAEADGTSVSITSAGVYVVSGECSDGQLHVDVDKEECVTVILDGLDLSSSTCPLLFEHGVVTLSLSDGTDNSISDGESYSLTVTSDDTNVDGALFCKDDLTITGSGSLTINGSYSHGVVCKDVLTIVSGTLNVTAVEDCIQANDGVTVSGGTLTLSAGDDGIHCDETLSVSGGSINVLSSYEGLEGSCIDVSGGTIYVVSSDDGFNAAGGSDNSAGWADFMAGDSSKSITISGGCIVIDAGGDGVDSNGTITVTGGVTLVSGPVSSADGAIDYGTSATISGGVFMAAGASGMAESFSDESAQGSIMVNVSGSAGETVALCDGDGNVLCSFTPAKQYGNIVISCPGITAGETYTICTGTVSGADENGYADSGTVSGASTLSTVEMTSLHYSEGGMMGGGMGGGGNMQQPGGGGMQQPGGQTGGTPPDAFSGATPQ